MLQLHKYEVTQGNYTQITGARKQGRTIVVWLTPRQVKRYKKKGFSFIKIPHTNPLYETPKEI